MSKESENVEVPIFEILVGIGIILIIIGAIAPLQRVEILGMTLWFDPNLAMILIPIGVGLICGYITRKILPNNNKSYLWGLFLGIIGIIVAVCIKPRNNTSKSNSNNANNKYVELQRLADLKRNGIITETEYDIQKERILRG